MNKGTHALQERVSIQNQTHYTFDSRQPVPLETTTQKRGNDNVSAHAYELLDKYLDAYGDMVYRVAFSYTKNKMDAEDVAQDVFLKLLSARPSFESTAHEKAWLLRVTINLSKNRLKSFWHTKTGALSDTLPYQDCPDADSGVLQAVLSLPTMQRLAVYLFYYEDYSTAEIAPLIQKKEATVRSLLHRARAALKDQLKEDYDNALL